MTPRSHVDTTSTVLIAGYGAHGQAVADALVARSVELLVLDDRPSSAALAHARSLGVELSAAPTEPVLASLMARATHLVPTPGLPDHHPAFAAAASSGVPVIGEFDLAAQWDARPVVAITGTNGKTTVTTLVTNMLVAGGRHAVAAGNMDLPLVTAIGDADADVFVVEASSFRLGHAASFAPCVGTWLNFEPDHLDAHASLEAYEAAKARIWRHAGPDDLAVANADDAIVMRNIPEGVPVQTFGSNGDAMRVGDDLILHGEVLMSVEELHRQLPHDISNALAAALTAAGVGADRAGISKALRDFAGLPHRMELVGERDGVTWYNDSKATTPHAVIAGVEGFESVVLIAGGRNKGVDLAPLGALTPRLRGVVAIGEAAEEIQTVFGHEVRVLIADSMQRGIEEAGDLARGGDVVVLSPACTSYDWYPNYEQRGEDYTRLVREHLGGSA